MKQQIIEQAELSEELLKWLRNRGVLSSRQNDEGNKAEAVRCLVQLRKYVLKHPLLDRALVLLGKELWEL